MLKEFNLLISTIRRREDDACSEAWYLLKEVGDEGASIGKTLVSGLIAVKTGLDPFEAIRRLEALARERPFDFKYTLRLVPVEVVVASDLKAIKEAVNKLLGKIGLMETFRVTVEKRASSLETMEIIKAAAELIERKVNLNNPDWIVLIEVIGGLTGVSVIKPSDIVSIVRLKESLRS